VMHESSSVTKADENRLYYHLYRSVDIFRWE